jgi:hypothetical protein
MRRAVRAAAAVVALAACASSPPERVPATPAGVLAPTGILAEDTAPKADLRMVPPEAYMRTYLTLFGGLAPLDAQKKARGGDGGNLFDTWDNYVSALGFPDYRSDVPRATQTNALMIASFERLGVALCDRAVEHDIKGAHPPEVKDRLIFAFEVPKEPVGPAAFAPRFDVLHRTFLGYPATLAPPQRVPRFYQVYRDIVLEHAKASPRSRFTPEEEGWAAVCYGLVRHPEFHLY